MVTQLFDSVQRTLTQKPMHTILGVIVTAMFLFAVYLVSPWYEQSPSAVIAVVFDSRNFQYALGAFYATPAIVYFTGLYRKSRGTVRASATMAFFVYIFATVLRLFTVGFTPLVWLFILAIGIIAAIIRLSLELQGTKGGVTQDGR